MWHVGAGGGLGPLVPRSEFRRFAHAGPSFRSPRAPPSNLSGRPWRRDPHRSGSVIPFTAGGTHGK